MLDLSAPFVLLDDAREGGVPARLYQAPVRIIEARTISAVLPALADIQAASAHGLHAVGYLSYEAAAAFEPVLEPPKPSSTPLLWFGLFEAFDVIACEDVAQLLPDPAGAWIGAPLPAIDQTDYEARLQQILALIEAGDLYQANLTFPAEVRFEGDPLAVYAQLRARSRAGFGAVVHSGSQTILSFSPELFFALEAGRLTCKPMKGTARRGDTPQADQAAIAALVEDPKQRAENLMIVDLTRNDLSRVAQPGSVAVPRLFEIETYPTVHQMVSTVTARIAEGKDAINVIQALFPCGSITGAPKIRAIETLAQIEAAPRGIYTGAIGRIDPVGDATFNVAIRTLTISAGSDHARFATGGGIVAESQALAEWDETQAKGAFLTAGQRAFDLIETMAFDPTTGIPLLERHLARMKTSADRFGFPFDRHAVRNELQAAAFRLHVPSKVRLLLAPRGAIAIETAAMPSAIPAPVRVAIVPLPVGNQDFRLRHKTSNRGFYDAPRQRSGQFEVVFTDPDGWLTEGSFTSLFVRQGDGLVTPPLSRGLLPGVLRAELIETGKAIEGDLKPADLSNGFLIGNALRGLIPAVMVAPQQTPRL